MQSTSAAITAAALSGTDLGAKASGAKGSDAAAKKSLGALGNNGFDANEAEAWMQSRWKSVYSSSTDKKLPENRKCDHTSCGRGEGKEVLTEAILCMNGVLCSTERPEVYKPAQVAAGSAWGPNKSESDDPRTILLQDYTLKLDVL